MLSTCSAAGRIALSGAAPTIAAAILGVFGGVRCVDQPTLEDRLAQPIVVTKFDPAASFASFTTFAVAEQVFTLTALGAGGGGTLDPAVADPMLQEIAAQLRSRGYVQVARSESPDLGVPVTLVSRLRVQVPYGSWWSFGSASPIYWNNTTATIVAGFDYSTIAWESGTVVIELEDLRDARTVAPTTAPIRPSVLPGATSVPSSAAVRVIWGGLLHGALGPADATLQTPPIASIRQAFGQSPYLHR